MSVRWTLSLAACCVLALSGTAPAAEWTIVPGQSRIGFEVTHAGRGITGKFETFTADIVFDPANLAAARADVIVDLASAATGDITNDKTLPTPDWFDTGKSRQGRFTTRDFKGIGGGAYEANGDLEIRGFKVPVTLAFMAKIEGDTLRVDGTTKLQRLAFGIGKGSDASGAWVSLDIPVQVTVVAKKK